MMQIVVNPAKIRPISNQRVIPPETIMKRKGALYADF